jgi:hypothetical protein
LEQATVQFVHQVLVKPMQLTLLPDDGHVNPLQARAEGVQESIQAAGNDERESHEKVPLPIKCEERNESGKQHQSK